MEFEPRYETYTVEELNDALSNIDKDEFPERAQLIQDQLRQRQQQVSVNADTEVVSSRLEGLKGSAFSPTQASVGALLGGPLASVYFLRKNFELMDNARGIKLTTLIGLAVVSLLIVLLGFIPDNVPNMLIPILTIAITRYLVEKYQCTKQEIVSVDNIAFQSNWHVFFVGLASLVVFMVVGMAVLLTLDTIGVITIE